MTDPWDEDLEEWLGDNWCCCGDAIIAKEFLVLLLQALHMRLDTPNRDAAEKEISVLLPTQPLRDIVLSHLTELELAEHGSVVTYSWITQEGQRLLQKLREGVDTDMRGS